MNLLTHFDLTLFDGSATAGGAGTGSGTGATAAENATGAQGERTGATTRRGKGEFANVKFGKQESAPAANEAPSESQSTQESAEDDRKAYDELINGKYKQFYTEDTQKMINRRFAGEKALKDQIASTQPIIDALMTKHGIKDNDLKALQKAIDEDDSYFEEAASEAGMSVENYKKVQKLEKQNKALLEEKEQQQGQQEAQAKVSAWLQEAEQLKATVPGFDINAEIAANPEFAKMLKNGVSVEAAYMANHWREITATAAQRAATQTERNVVANVRAKGNRPQENGTASSQGAFTVKDDVRKLSRAERAEIALRAQRGERITF